MNNLAVTKVSVSDLLNLAREIVRKGLQTLETLFLQPADYCFAQDLPREMKSSADRILDQQIIDCLMPTKLPMNDGEPLIARLEQSQEDGDADHVEGNMERLERLIAQYQDRVHELTDLQYRARLVRDRHEPPAQRRITARANPF